ncbi:MAG TPA: cysteine dioxygenase family protein [Solirubrobacteraceae bacterium]|nr:cysteine dioxygenase family protein [Solirubrobacteraceae bacterium]
MLPTHREDLDAAALTELVQGLAERPDHWHHLVSHRADSRTYEQLHRDDHVAVWLICWMNDHDTGFHDHDVSAGALTVVRGRVREERLVLGGPPAGRTLSAGQSLAFAASDIHRVSHAGTEPAVTLHAYSPPLWRMGAYELSPDGTLRRHSMSYAEELRPLDEVGEQLAA